MPDRVTPGDGSPDAAERPANERGRGGRSWLILAAVFPLTFLAFVLGLLRWYGPGRSSNPPQPTVAERLSAAKASGQQARPFTLDALAGRGSISLDQFLGKIVVLNVWASWCPPCRQEAPQLESVWRSYRDRGVQFLGVDHKDSRSAAMAFQRQFGVTYPSAFDPQGTVAAQYGLVGIPSTVIIDSRGRVRYRFLGKIDAPLLSAALDGVLSNGRA